jgi:hypothetical protein
MDRAYSLGIKIKLLFCLSVLGVSLIISSPSVFAAQGMCYCTGEETTCDQNVVNGELSNCKTMQKASCKSLANTAECTESNMSSQDSTTKINWLSTGQKITVVYKNCKSSIIDDNQCTQLKKDSDQYYKTNVPSTTFDAGSIYNDSGKPTFEIRKPIINILIPDLKFSDVRTTTDDEGNVVIPWIGEYIAAVYRLAVGVASILAVVLLIREGALIVLSGGGEQKIQGYRNIVRIMLGLVLAWSSSCV